MISQIRKPHKHWEFELLIFKIFSKVQKIIKILSFQFSE